MILKGNRQKHNTMKTAQQLKHIATKAIAKFFVLVLIAFYCVSCDISKPFVIDGRKKYITSSDCGNIIINGYSFSYNGVVFISIKFDGMYVVNTDLLKLETVTKIDSITNIGFKLNKEEIVGKEIRTKKGDVVDVWCNLQSTIPYQKPTGVIQISPSSFITCGGNPIINDTLRIQLND
jgi:hypothetical protein